MSRVSVIIPGRCEQYFQKTIESVLESATGDIEVIAVVDGYVPDPPIVVRDNRVKLLHLNTPIGQRAGYNLGIRESTGKYVMKIDAHALLSKGFDDELKRYCPPKTTILPEMRRLDVRKWEPKKGGRTHYMYFGLDLYCHYWRDYKKRIKSKSDYQEVLTGQGSCWFCEREWNDYIGLLDESVGSWGNVGIEISLRTWLCGGTQIVNKKVWQAHWFRVGDGGFPYPMDGRKVHKAHQYTWNNYYFKNDAFKNQVRPFYWLLNKFKPVPSWETYIDDKYESNRVIVYYTDNKIENSLAVAVRKQLKKVAGLIPIISVSQKPIDFGTNICVGEKPKNYISMYEQILTGVNSAPSNSIVYLCEHDVFYHPSHFKKKPKNNRAMWFNQNRYYWQLGLPYFFPALGKKAMSQGVAYRKYIKLHCEKRLSAFKSGGGAEFNIRWFSYKSERPNVDVRHSDNMTKDGKYKKSYLSGGKRGVYNIGGWGGVNHFQGIVKYKGTMRYDIIETLIEKYGYNSYLEIGVDKKVTFNYVQCDVKHGVDPNKDCTYKMQSDEFFKSHINRKYGIIFVDGMHEAVQAKRDIENALYSLNDNGVIVVHDCNPRNEKEQSLNREPGQKAWTGDVWKAFVRLRKRDDIEMYTVDTNNGIGIIKKGAQHPFVVHEDNLTYNNFESNKKEWLNLISVKEFRNKIGV